MRRQPCLVREQDDGSYVITCPNKDKAGIQAAALSKIAKIQAKRKSQNDNSKRYKKEKSDANVAFENLTEEQKVLCIKEATRCSSATTNSTAGHSSTRDRTAFVVTVEVLSAEPNRPPMPISIQSNFSHIVLSLGPSLDMADFPDIRCAVDTCAGLCTGSFHYLMALDKRYLQCLYKLFTS